MTNPQTAQEEREAIVAWLGRISQGAKMPKAIAEAIQRGDHLAKIEE